jgi:hypothetical protein
MNSDSVRAVSKGLQRWNEPVPVLVHLSTPVPRYLVNGLARLTRQFPTEVVLITDARLRPIPGVTLVHPRDLGIDHNWIAPTGLMQFEIRRHLWTTSYTRLVAIARFAQMHEGPIMHLESDVVVLWPEGLAAWGASQPAVAFPLMDDGLGIASTVMIRNAHSASEFLDRLLPIAEALEMASEMDYLGHLQRMWPEVVLLPRAPGDRGHSPAAQQMSQSLNEESLRQGLSLTDLEGAVFDGAALGISICGVDPIHTRGIVRTGTAIHRDKLAPKSFVLSAEGTADSLRLVIRDQERPEVTGRVVTLHCNSKEPQLFRTDGAALYRRVRGFNRGPRPVNVSPAAIRELLRLRMHGVSRRLHGHVVRADPARR